MKRAEGFLLLIAFIFLPVVAVQADLIDFESEGFPFFPVIVPPIVTATNIVTFGVGGTDPTGPAFTANVGGIETAFVPDDIPQPSTDAGDFFLTDEPLGPSIASNYFIDFANPVLNLSLDLYDYRDDGGPSVGDTATLTAYADAARTTPVGSDTFIIVPNLPDGNVVKLSIPAPTAHISSASITFSGNGDVGTGIDNIEFLTDTGRKVGIDIKPQSCPNPLNVGSKGVLPVAVLGDAKFDVTQIDPASVRLEGVAPLRWSTEDVATPFEGLREDAYDCTEEGPDGFLDLTLKFAVQEIAAALSDVEDGEVRALALTGNLKQEFGGTAIQGMDVVIIKEEGKLAPGSANIYKLYDTWGDIKSRY